MSEKPVSFGSILRICEKENRRIVLGALGEEQRSLTLNDLIESILKNNHQMSPTEAPENVLTGIRLSLDQVDLPKLAAVGLINYDREGGLVESTEKLAQVQPTLSTILGADPSLTAPIAP